ncbi:MAG: hypothetical protein LBT73_03340 [Tannerellaceae bacterium]|jgi:hypothetical protein|nr:hypothetical protein [Tannerellaceae bacterium]
MKDFFLRLTRFTLHLALVVILVCVAMRIFLHTDFHEPVIRSKGASTIILGDSHTEFGLVADSIGEAFNFSNGSERYVLNLKKLQALSEVYPIKRVILSLSYHSFIDFSPGEGQEEQGFYYRYCFTLYPFIRPVEKLRCLELFGYSEMPEAMLCHEIGFPPPNSLALIEHKLRGNPFLFTPSKEIAPLPIDWESRINLHFYGRDTSDLRKVNSSFVTGIWDIRSFCEEKGYKLVLFNAPVSQSYYAHIPPVYKQLTDSIVNLLVDNRTTYYVDYTQYPLPDSCFWDGDHTNLYGANIITPLLRDSLRALGILP